MNVQSITLQYLQQHGFDGLHSPCNKGDLMPCMHAVGDCRSGCCVPKDSPEFSS